MRNWEEWHGDEGNKEEMSEIRCIANTCLPRRGSTPLTLLRQEKTCYTRTSPNFNFLVFFEFLIEFLVGFPD